MSDETAKIPLSMPKLSWASMNDSELMRLHNEAVGGATGDSKARATTITSGSPGYDGTSDPGEPGAPV